MEGTWKKGNVQNIQEVRSGNPVAFIYVLDLLSGLLLGFRKEIHDAFTTFRRLFTCGKTTELPLYLPTTEADLL